MSNNINFNIFSPKPNEKICLVVYGNLASGKSSFSKEIKKLLPNYSYVCLDEIRIKNMDKFPNKSVYERESISKEECKNEILNSQLVIYESTGTSQLFNQLKNRIRAHFKTYFIFISCPDYECRKRFENRKYNGYFSVKPPVKKSMSIYECCSANQYVYWDMKKDLELNTFTHSLEEIVCQFKSHFNYS